MGTVPLLAAALALAAAPASADLARLDNGVSLEGVLVSSDAATLTLEVADGGLVTLDSATVTSLTRSSPAADARLRSRWRAERRAADARERREAAFARRQRERGLVQYEGDWITRAELDARLAEEGLRPAAPPPAETRVVVIERLVESPPAVFRAALPYEPARAGGAAKAREPGRLILRRHAPGVTAGPLRTGFDLGVPEKFEIPY